MNIRGNIIECSNVWLRYNMSADGSKSFKSTVINFLKTGRKSGDFWGLQDISFTLVHGETLGILGPNGSGKSSLLKILSRIFQPDKGTVAVNGTLASLLEVGAGFQRDLTGRENIFLNGSILGLKRSQIREKFDRIVEFAELSDFIDTPIRHYSSGMYARLGFAVAVHLDPDCIIIDEVLSVGDQLFQRKCFEKLNEFKSQGKTIILVSHNLAALSELCTRCLWLDAGKMVMDDQIQQVLNAYIKYNFEQQAARYQNEADRFKDARLDHGTPQRAEITNIAVLDASGERTHTVHTGDTVTVEISYRTHEKITEPVFGIAFQKRDGTIVTGPNSMFDGYEIQTLEGSGKVIYTVQSLPLLPGTFVVSASIYDKTLQYCYDYLDKIYPFQVLEGNTKQKFGMIHLAGTWDMVKGPS